MYIHSKTNYSLLTRICIGLILITLLNLTSYAGSKYHEGYIILLNGDTIHGLLLVQNSLNASKQCVFKKEIMAEPTTFSPGEIHGYRYTDGKFYISKRFSDKQSENIMVFMECLVDGILSFYYVRDIAGEHYYAEKETIGLTELTNEKLQDERPYVFKARYRAKLYCCTADCTAINPKINKTVLTHKSLIDLSKDYQELVCPSKKCIIYERQKPTPEYRFTLLLGMPVNHYSFGNRLVSNYSPGVQLGVGFQMHNILFYSEKLYLDVNLLLERDFTFTMSKRSDYPYNYPVSYKGIDYTFNSQGSFTSKQNLTVDLNVLGLKIPITVNFKVPIKQTTLHVGFGISDKIILSYNKQYVDASFNEQYGKTFNTFLAGGVINFGIDLNMKHGNVLGINVNGEYLFVPTAMDLFLRLRESQIGVQLIYGFKKF